MPPLIRFLLGHFGNGAMLSLALGEVVLLTGVARLGPMLAASPSGATLTALFFLQAALTFGTLNAAVAVLTLSGPGR